MATKKQKEQLVEILKFTPRTYTIRLFGYGGEAVMGTVDRKVYDYFTENDIDVEEYVGDYDNELEVPGDVNFAAEGSWYDNDNICHVNGVEMADGCWLAIDDENGTEILETSLDPGNLDDLGVNTFCGEEHYISQQPPGTVVFYGQSFEKGSFFEGRIELKQPFDIKKLGFSYVDVDGWLVCDGVSYDDESLESDDYSTTGKSSTYSLTLVEEDDVEPYVRPETPEPYYAEESEFTDYFPGEVKPSRPGSYECVWSSGFGTSYGRLEWNGTDWIEYEYKKPKIVTGVKEWRGLNWDTSDWNNCPQVPNASEEDLVQALEELKAEFEELENDSEKPPKLPKNAWPF